MHAASRESLASLRTELDALLGNSGNAVAEGATTGSELFDVVELLDSDRGLRRAVADQSASAEERSGLIRGLLEGKVSELTLKVVGTAAAQTWSSSRDLRNALVELGRVALLRSAEGQRQLETVEDELFRLGHILATESQLEQLLADKAATPEAKRGLLASVLYGKVTSVTEALALQVVGRPELRPADDMNSLSGLAASLRNKVVARVTSAATLSTEQEGALGDKLSRIYGDEMSIHTEVDESILGGLVIRVGDEVIDGSLSSKIEKLRLGLG
ncbi:F0F1 ATP synthase subunit delta [Corynebacterium sputi]|uniref:F0F1 ATP synthase subunit delta n=1 Tax=Corynebacterium sputi TaxID=489915 RepID=UPI0003F8440B|nr:F0F1 ATP synthase subunit delta [Corynebacterium sputi]